MSGALKSRILLRYALALFGTAVTPKTADEIVCRHGGSKATNLRNYAILPIEEGFCASNMSRKSYGGAFL
jgi:hypothetical protein